MDIAPNEKLAHGFDGRLQIATPPDNSLGAILERMELIAVDTRKAFSYNKSTGLWAWYDRNDTSYHNGFTTRFDALVDATEPYMEES